MEFVYDDQLIKLVFTDSQDYLSRHLNKTGTFFEEPYLRFLKDIINNESVVIDVGAHVGNHTIYFSKILKAKKVISIEPTKRSYETLCENIEINNLQNVETHRVALGSSRGVGKCYVRKVNNSGANQWSLTVEKSEDEETVLVALLTDVVKEKADFIKIDVESYELEVLKGSLDFIAEYRPYLMVEVLKNNLNTFEKLMKELNYIYIGTEIFKKNPKRKANTLLIRGVNKHDSRTTF